MRRQRHPRRLPDLPDRHRAGGDPPRRDRDDRGDPRGQAALPRRADHARRVQRLVRPEPGGPAGAQLGVPARVQQGRPGLRDRARVEDPARSPGSPRSSARSRSTWSTTAAGTATTRWPGSWSCSRGWTRPRHGSAGRGAGRAAAVGAARAPDHRRRAHRPGGRPRRGDGPAARPGDHQRLPARRDEDGRRAVRLRPDAAAVRAAVRRGDEGRRRLPRAAHGEVRRGRQGQDRAGDGARATCTTSARTWSTSS